jgi:hypothetical protein
LLVIGIFDVIARSMERLGYLKRIMKRASLTPTSNLENLGSDLINTVSQKVKVKINRDIYQYARSRIRAEFLKPVQKEIDGWLENINPAPEINIELQDLYLSQPAIPSRVGRLVKDNWRRYPSLAINLGLIRKGTYSINTRGLSFLHFTPAEEFKAFNEYLPNNNPLVINSKQGLLLLYSFFENDGEVIIPLWKRINSEIGESFTEKQAGQFIPDVYKEIISRYRKMSLAIDIRERLEVLENTANNINSIPEKGYGGTSPLDTAVRPRIEPYVDLGIFIKNDPSSHDYSLSHRGKIILKELELLHNSKEINLFLATEFFHTAASAWEIKATLLSDPGDIIARLKQAAKIISSPSGYSPIEELALLAGIDSLLDDHMYFEIGSVREIIIAYQKTNPYQIRFTVDRMGTLTNAKFIDK